MIRGVVRIKFSGNNVEKMRRQLRILLSGNNGPRVQGTMYITGVLSVHQY
jgi:hypothetical protein